MVRRELRSYGYSYSLLNGEPRSYQEFPNHILGDPLWDLLFPNFCRKPRRLQWLKKWTETASGLESTWSHIHPTYTTNISYIIQWLYIYEKNVCIYIDILDIPSLSYTGWWFGTFFKYVSIYWEFNHPNWLSLIFFRGVGLNHQPGIIHHLSMFHDQ